MVTTIVIGRKGIRQAQKQQQEHKQAQEYSNIGGKHIIIIIIAVGSTPPTIAIIFTGSIAALGAVIGAAVFLVCVRWDLICVVDRGSHSEKKHCYRVARINTSGQS